jgi:hypothetical protein
LQGNALGRFGQYSRISLSEQLGQCLLPANRKGQYLYDLPVATYTGLGRHYHGAGRSCGYKVNIGDGVEHGGLNDGGVAMTMVAGDMCFARARGGQNPRHRSRGQLMGHGGE